MIGGKGYKRGTSPAKSVKHKKTPKNKRGRNGYEKMVAVEGVVKRFKKGFTR
jgi:hypothetical protein